MKSPNIADSEQLRDRLIALGHHRGQVKDANRRLRLDRLTAAERADILSNTGAKCHICSGDIRGPWNADHVMAHSAGGKHSTTTIYLLIAPAITTDGATSPKNSN